MKFLILIMVLCIAFAIAEAKQGFKNKKRVRGGFGRNFGGRHHDRLCNHKRRESFKRFGKTMRPLPVILENPEQFTEPKPIPQPVEVSLIHNFVNNLIEDNGDLPSDGLVGNSDHPTYSVIREILETLLKSVIKNQLKEVHGNSEKELPMRPSSVLEKPEHFPKPVTTPQAVKDTVVENVVNNPIKDNGELPVNGILGKPYVQMIPSAVSIAGEPDVQI